MNDYCEECEYYSKCDLAGTVNFCDDCAESDTCDIKGVSCDKGHDVECNNGFEPKDY